MPDPAIALPDLRLTLPEVIALHAESLDRSRSMSEQRGELEARSVAARRDLLDFDLPMVTEAEMLLGLVEGGVPHTSFEQRYAHRELLELGRRLRLGADAPGRVVDVEALLSQAHDTNVPTALTAFALARLVPATGEALRATLYLRHDGTAAVACALLWLPLSALCAAEHPMDLFNLPHMERGWGPRDETDARFYDR